VSTMIQCQQEDAGTSAGSDHSHRARTELSVMQLIADQLAQLPDDTARRRVLQWANEMFGVKCTAPAAALSLVEPNRVQTAAAPLRAVPHAAADDPDDDLSLGNLSDWFEVATAPLENSHAQTQGDEPVVSMIHDFVSDFQKLAHDWQEH
jgi:hypothetical protein